MLAIRLAANLLNRYFPVTVVVACRTIDLGASF